MPDERTLDGLSFGGQTVTYSGGYSDSDGDGKIYRDQEILVEPDIKPSAQSLLANIGPQNTFGQDPFDSNGEAYSFGTSDGSSAAFDDF